MNYEEFKETLQQEIQANFLQHIDFLSQTIEKTNETLDSLIMRFEGQSAAPAIYPAKLYEDYKNGQPIPRIADSVSASISMDFSGCPGMPEITPGNAAKSISFSLVNKERNQHLLEKCPYKDVHDMAAVPRWHISNNASFLVNNFVMQTLRMTKEEILGIAQKNTESAEYTCRGLDEVLREFLREDGIDEESINEMLWREHTPYYKITNTSGIDGSCAVLSDKFMQQAAGQLGFGEMYLLPSSRHEMLILNPDSGIDPANLKAIVESINSKPYIIRPEDYLSDSVYKYNAKTHSLAVCDSRGMFHDKPSTSRDSIKPQGRGRGL